MNNQINSPAGYYQQNPIHSGQPVQQTVIPSQSVSHSSIPASIQSNDQFDSDYDIINDGLVDPVQKSKDVMTQLKLSLQALMEQLVIVLNPPSETSPLQTENHYQLLGKHIESFNRACDLLTVNLKVACEAQEISNELKTFSKYYAYNSQIDSNRNEVPFINSINIHMQRIGEFQNMISQYLAPKNINHTDS